MDLFYTNQSHENISLSLLKKKRKKNFLFFKILKLNKKIMYFSNIKN